ncbi:MAG: DEAD/DEAH box helicase [Caulobacterales bacterium]|nr:DEAD/DEAH box helicase [Caulobacterales bacterium]HRX37792.1 DEAD/DEAH box helicase [Parvularculaceae bacterium]
MTFEELGLEPPLLKALAESGYATPTPIQEAAIPEALRGRDVLGIAQTGTGKTASFTLPMIQRLSKGRARARMPRSLVLAPTRELAAQVAENFEKYGKYHKLSMALLIGGVSFGDQDAKLMRGVDVLIATPGRLLDHFERGKLLLNGIEMLVVDEADRMLDMGFIPDIERIFKLTPLTRQTLFFSATMPPEIQRITDTFLREPARVEVARPATTAETITQRVVRLDSKADNVKRAVLRKLLDSDGVKNGIIFCNRKTTVDVVAKSLQKHGYNARPIHGDLAQAFRMETLDKFRSGETKFLVASDVAARGLDIPDVSHVFNFDIPIHPEDYVHRIGRTGRAGREGAAFSIVTPLDDKHYGAILKTIGKNAIETIEVEVDVEPRESRSRSGSRDSRGRRSGDASQSRERRPRRERSPRAKQPVALDFEEAATPAEPIRHSAPGAPERHIPTLAERQPEKPRDRRLERRPERQKEPHVVGMGDHVPDFLLR